ncbi:centrosomal protein of 112 kDa isoform X2 [Nothobranchius furzeri]|uniref:Centrosomal protein 112 n=1 Tax=Nothobranchius furzeri TaxID=105023 RepID=A0A8C6PNI8_NOTFU
MKKQEGSWERLDTEFDHLLLDMKPYMLKHPNKTERQHCAVWIKKLCDPAACGSDRKNRNMYARVLLHMLKRGVLEGPFTSKPEHGGLKTLPAYMSIYFEEPLSGLCGEQSNRGVPDWVRGDLSGCTDDSLAADLLKKRPSSTPVRALHRRRLNEEENSSLPMSSSPLKQAPRKDARRVDGVLKANPYSDDSDLEACLNSWSLGMLTSSFERNNTFANDHDPQSKEMKIKVLEAKHQEEKLRMQQRHDADVEKILDRKNGEIDEMKSLYRAKQKESEEMIRKLEKKVQSVLRESQVICESKEKQISELKKMSDHSADSIRNELEKKLHAAVADMEQEKYKMQKKHTENIQELLEDTNQRLARMESENSAREQIMHDLEKRVSQQSVEVERGNALRQKVSQEKAQLEIHMASLSAELQEANRRVLMLQKEKEQQSEQHEQTLQKLQVKHEADISHLHQEHALSAAKASEVIEDLEKTVAQLKQQLQDIEYRRHHHIKDQEMKFRQEKDELQINYEKKVSEVHREAEEETTEAKRKIAKLEDALREMESQLDRARESQRQLTQQADLALEQLKKQVQLSSEKAYDDMKLQMAEQRAQHDQERTRLQQQHSAEKDSLVQEHQREVSVLERQARATLQQHQQHNQEWRQRDAQTISDLNEKVSRLYEELQQVQVQHNHKLAEMALLQDEERQRSLQDKEASLEQLRSDMEQNISDLKRNHQQELDAARERANSRLKQIEEYSQRLAKSAQLIAELQTSVCDSKEEAVRLQKAMEKQLKEANACWDQERRTITHHADQTTKALQEKVESLQRQLLGTEKKLLSKELEMEEKVTMVHQEYEQKIKGLMPADLRQELEDTITSLQAQVSFLQKTTSLLQEDLDACRSRR